MNILKTKRLDHLGLVMGGLQELNIIAFIDEKLGNHQLEKVSTGEAIASFGYQWFGLFL